MPQEPETANAPISRSLLKSWLLSESIGRQTCAAILLACLIGAIASFKGVELSLDAALAFSALIVMSFGLDVVRLLSKRDPVYGLSLAWKMGLVLLFGMAAVIVGTAVLAVIGDESVSDLWSILFKAGLGVPLGSTLLRTDPKG